MKIYISELMAGLLLAAGHDAWNDPDVVVLSPDNLETPDDP